MELDEASIVMLSKTIRTHLAFRILTVFKKETIGEKYWIIQYFFLQLFCIIILHKSKQAKGLAKASMLDKKT